MQISLRGLRELRVMFRLCGLCALCVWFFLRGLRVRNRLRVGGGQIGEEEAGGGSGGRAEPLSCKTKAVQEPERAMPQEPEPQQEPEPAAATP